MTEAGNPVLYDGRLWGGGLGLPKRRLWITPTVQLQPKEMKRAQRAYNSSAVRLQPFVRRLTRRESYRSHPLSIADFARVIMPEPIRTATSGAITANAPMTLIASEPIQMWNV